ncbi:hypothetical protein VP1G_10360 [Cytospora mali]|nr:hypothetical protein VP1G_10360 [Valsa mali var. pyri (nom. inval.)]
MRAVSLIPLLLPMGLASPFTFPSQPNQRHVTLTAQDGRPLVLTIAQTITRTSTITPTTPTPPSFPGSSGPRKTGRPEEDELELRAIFASTTGSSDSAASTSTSTSTSSEDEDTDSGSDSDSDSSSDTNSDSGETEAQTSVKAVVAAAQTTPAPPANDPEVASALAEQGYSQVTYYTCMTRDAATYTHCGWHVPVVKVSGAAKDGSRGKLRVGMAALGVACAVGVGNIVLGG